MTTGRCSEESDESYIDFLIAQNDVHRLFRIDELLIRIFELGCRFKFEQECIGSLRNGQRRRRYFVSHARQVCKHWQNLIDLPASPHFNVTALELVFHFERGNPLFPVPLTDDQKLKHFLTKASKFRRASRWETQDTPSDLYLSFNAFAEFIPLDKPCLEYAALHDFEKSVVETFMQCLFDLAKMGGRVIGLQTYFQQPDLMRSVYAVLERISPAPNLEKLCIQGRYPDSPATPGPKIPDFLLGSREESLVSGSPGGFEPICHFGSLRVLQIDDLHPLFKIKVPLCITELDAGLYFDESLLESRTGLWKGLFHLLSRCKSLESLRLQVYHQDNGFRPCDDLNFESFQPISIPTLIYLKIVAEPSSILLLLRCCHLPNLRAFLPRMLHEEPVCQLRYPSSRTDVSIVLIPGIMQLDYTLRGLRTSVS